MPQLTRLGHAAYAYLLVFFLLLPEAVAVGVSFNPGHRMVLPTEAFSLRWYDALWQSPEYARAFLLSVGVAATATVLSMLLGCAAAFGLTSFQVRSLGVVHLLMFAPLVVPAAALGAALFLFEHQLRLTETVPGIVIGHIVVTLPYTFRTMLASFAGFDRSLIEASESLGAGTLTTLRRVILPLIRPGLVASALFAFIVSLDEFTLTLFVSGRSVVTLPLQIFNSIEYGLDPTVAAASTVLIAITALVIVLLERFVGLSVAYPMGR